MKVVKVYTARYSRPREEGGTSEVDIEDNRGCPALFNDKRSAIATTRKRAEKEGWSCVPSSVQVEARKAIQLKNGRRFLLAKDEGYKGGAIKGSTSSGAVSSVFKESTKRWIVKGKGGGNVLYTETTTCEPVTIWNGKGNPPGDHSTDLVIKDAGRYYLLDSFALIGFRTYLELRGK